MIQRYTYHGITWLDVATPSEAELRELVEHEGVDPRIGEELSEPTPEPIIERYGAALFTILHFPASQHSHQNGKNQEIDLVITPDKLITVRYDTIDAVHKFSKIVERESVNDPDGATHPSHGALLAVALLKKLYGSVQHELEYIRDTLTGIEREIFSGREKAMVFSLSEVSRELLNIEQVILSHEEALERFKEHSGDLFNGTAEFNNSLQVLLRTYRRIRATIQHRKNSFHELRETNDSLLSTKQNEIMKTLTILAFVTFPLTLVSSIFSMNMRDLPIIGHPNDFWIIIGIMLFLTVLFFAYFKHKKWL